MYIMLCVSMLIFVFFFSSRRRHTRFDCGWSSDVCSSDLFVLSEFLERRAPHYVPPRLNREVLVHGHCHRKAILKMTDEESLLKKMGVEEIGRASCRERV